MYTKVETRAFRLGKFSLHCQRFPWFLLATCLLTGGSYLLMVILIFFCGQFTLRIVIGWPCLWCLLLVVRRISSTKEYYLNLYLTMIAYRLCACVWFSWSGVCRTVYSSRLFSYIPLSFRTDRTPSAAHHPESGTSLPGIAPKIERNVFIISGASRLSQTGGGGGGGTGDANPYCGDAKLLFRKNFPPKLHEIERIGPRGGSPSDNGVVLK